MANQTAGLNVNITDNAKQAATNLNSFTAAAQKAQQVVKDFSSGLVSGAREAWQEHTKATQNAVQPTKQFSDQVQKSNSIVEKFADTLTRRFITGLIITQLRQFTQQLVAMNAELARTSDLASRSGAGNQGLQGLLGAAGNAGIEPTQFLDAFDKLNQQVLLAKRGTGDLLTLFKQNGLQVTNTSGAFAQISRLVSSTGDEQAKVNFLQAAGLGTSTQWLRLMDQGPDKILAQADAFHKLTDAEIEAAKTLDREFNAAWANVTQYGKQAFVSIATVFHDAFKQDIEDVTRIIAFFQSLPGFAAKYNSSLTGLPQPAPLKVTVPVGQNILPPRTDLTTHGGDKTAVDPELLKLQNQQIQQQISLLGTLATADDLVKSKRAELNLASLNNINLSSQMRDAILAETRLQSEASTANARLSLGLATQSDIRKQILAGMPPQLRAEAELTVAYQKQTEQLQMNNEVAKAALPGLKQLENSSKDLRTQLDTLGQGITNGISGPLVDLASGATKAGDAFKQMGLNVIRSIEQMIVNMTIAAPIARGLQSILGGFLPGAGIGAAGQPTQLGDATFVQNASGNVFGGQGISAFSNTIVDRPTVFPFAKGIGLMGEAGAEAIMPLTRIGGKLGVRASGGSSDTYIDMSGMNITLPQDPNGNDPTGAVRSNAVAKALEGTVRNIVKDEMIQAQKPRGMMNRASAI